MIYKIHPLSESASTIYLEQKISEEINDFAISMAKWIEKHPFEGLIEVVPAIASVTVFYDLIRVKETYSKGRSAFGFVKKYIKSIPIEKLESTASMAQTIEVPVRYNGQDLGFVAEHCGMSKENVVTLHAAGKYRVYMMGFLPGFPYLGGMNEQLSTPRRAKPRLKVKAGSVGIAGGQTGIYPFDSPGGWQIIGETNLKLFDPQSKELTLLRAGDQVVFRPI